MKSLIATSALALLVGMGAARADQVVIEQKFDLDRIDQTIENEVKAKGDVSDTALEGTNVQNLIDWTDLSADWGLYRGDSYDFRQYTDEEQEILNTVTSKSGDIEATLAATNLQNVINLKDDEGGSLYRGEKIDARQILGDTWQKGVNEIVAGDDHDGRDHDRDHDRRPSGSHAVLAGTMAEITNLANVANVVDRAGAGGRELALDLDQKAYGAKQTAENKVRADSVTGTTLKPVKLEALNGMNIASFDLANQGRAHLDVTQKTMDVTQTISNSIEAGTVSNATLAGTNLGNVVTVKVDVEG